MTRNRELGRTELLAAVSLLLIFGDSSSQEAIGSTVERKGALVCICGTAGVNGRN